MTDILLEQTYATMASDEVKPSTSFLSKLFTPKPSKLYGINGSIYAHMCQELEPERDFKVPDEAWNASLDPAAQRLRYRSDSEISTTSTQVATPVKSPIFDVPKWSWPDLHLKENGPATAPISEPLKPQHKG